MKKPRETQTLPRDHAAGKWLGQNSNLGLVGPRALPFRSLGGQDWPASQGGGGGSGSHAALIHERHEAWSTPRGPSQGEGRPALLPLGAEPSAPWGLTLGCKPPFTLCGGSFMGGPG